MAVIHRAQITPTKAELITGWLPSQAWSNGAPAPLELLGAYRFDDPAGEVGIETHLVRTGHGRVLQVPLTYRGAPLEGAERHLVGTTEHSHLGCRWVYDACGDPVYAAVLVATIRTGGREAEQWVETDGDPMRREATTHVVGSGAPGADMPAIGAVSPVDGPATTTIAGLVVLRIIETGIIETGIIETGIIETGTVETGTVGQATSPEGAETLTGTWPGRDEPTLLAYLPR